MSENEQRIDVRHATLHSIVEGRAGHRHLEVHGLTGSSPARLLAELLATSERTLAILVADQKQAARLAAGPGLGPPRPRPWLSEARAGR